MDEHHIGIIVEDEGESVAMFPGATYQNIEQALAEARILKAKGEPVLGVTVYTFRAQQWEPVADFDLSGSLTHF